MTDWSDGLGDILVGAPNAGHGGSCDSPGMVYLFLATSDETGALTGWTRLTLQAPAPGGTRFGWSVGLTDGAPFFLVGESGRSPSGQEYLYRIVP